MMIIQKRVKLSENESFVEDGTSSIMVKTIYLFKKNEKVDLSHMLWASNHLANGQVNVGVALEQGSLSINQDVKTCYIL